MGNPDPIVFDAMADDPEEAQFLKNMYEQQLRLQKAMSLDPRDANY